MLAIYISMLIFSICQKNRLVIKILFQRNVACHYKRLILLSSWRFCWGQRLSSLKPYFSQSSRCQRPDRSEWRHPWSFSRACCETWYKKAKMLMTLRHWVELSWTHNVRAQIFSRRLFELIICNNDTSLNQSVFLLITGLFCFLIDGFARRHSFRDSWFSSWNFLSHLFYRVSCLGLCCLSVRHLRYI